MISSKRISLNYPTFFGPKHVTLAEVNILCEATVFYDIDAPRTDTYFLTSGWENLPDFDLVATVRGEDGYFYHLLRMQRVTVPHRIGIPVGTMPSPGQFVGSTIPKPILPDSQTSETVCEGMDKPKMRFGIRW